MTIQCRRCGGCDFGISGTTQVPSSGPARHVECHRYPDIVLKHADDFCGEYVPKSDDQPESKES